MVKKYIILADSSVDFEIPRQLSVINGEALIKRTIRLLKENGIKDIIITSHDKRFDDLGVERYEPLYNNYDAKEPKSHWLKAFPIELMKEPTVYLFGDVYYSENAIKTIIREDNDDILFFCTYKNKCPLYIKSHDEPLAFKVHNFEKFKFHIDRLIKMWDNDETIRRPITWELYRSINGQDVNEHKMTNNYIAINDESCDIDKVEDIKLLNERLGGIKMIKVEVIENFTLKDFKKLKNLERATSKSKEGELYVKDTFECDEVMAKYLTGDNAKKKVVVKVLEVIPEEIIIPEAEISFSEEKVEPKVEVKIEEKPKKKRTSKKNK